MFDLHLQTYDGTVIYINVASLSVESSLARPPTYFQLRSIKKNWPGTKLILMMWSCPHADFLIKQKVAPWDRHLGPRPFFL